MKHLSLSNNLIEFSHIYFELHRDLKINMFFNFISSMSQNYTILVFNISF